MSILSMLLNPIPVPEPKKVRKVIDGIEVKPPRSQRGEGRYDYVEYWMPNAAKSSVQIKKRGAPQHLIEHNKILHEQTFARYKAAAGGDWISTPDLQKALGISVNSGLKELKSWHEQEKIECRVMAGYESARRPRYEWRFK